LAHGAIKLIVEDFVGVLLSFGDVECSHLLRRHQHQSNPNIPPLPIFGIDLIVTQTRGRTCADKNSATRQIQNFYPTASTCHDQAISIMSAELPTTPPSPVQTKATAIGPGLTLLSPLTRRGRGPGLLLLASDQNATLDIRDGVPSSLVKWAEEGYSVVAIGASAVKTEKANIAQVLDDSIKALEDCSECEPRGTYGLVGMHI
jgi:hypothetical protein